MNLTFNNSTGVSCANTGRKFIATEGANGMPFAGWHSHRLPVIGDWKTIQEVMGAYGIEVIE